MATNYLQDLTGKSAQEVGDLIKQWREDENAGTEDAGDLFASLEKWLGVNPVFAFSDKVYRALRDYQDGHLESSVNVCVGKLSPTLTLAYDVIVQAFKDHASNHSEDTRGMVTRDITLDHARSFCIAKRNGFVNDPLIHRLMVEFAKEVLK